MSTAARAVRHGPSAGQAQVVEVRRNNAGAAIASEARAAPGMGRFDGLGPPPDFNLGPPTSAAGTISSREETLREVGLRRRGPPPDFNLRLPQSATITIPTRDQTIAPPPRAILLAKSSHCERATLRRVMIADHNESTRASVHLTATTWTVRHRRSASRPTPTETHRRAFESFSTRLKRTSTTTAPQPSRRPNE
jgi:hypothetical protein